MSGKSEENKSFQPHDFSAFYLCYDRTLLLFSRPIIDKDTSALIPHDCDPHLNQTKFNDLLPLTFDGVLGVNHSNLLPGFRTFPVKKGAWLQLIRAAEFDVRIGWV